MPTHKGEYAKGRPNNAEWQILNGEDVVKVSSADFSLIVRDEIVALFQLDHPQRVQIKNINPAGVSFTVILDNYRGQSMHSFLPLPLIFRNREVKALPPYLYNYYIDPN